MTDENCVAVFEWRGRERQKSQEKKKKKKKNILKLFYNGDGSLGWYDIENWYSDARQKLQ